MRPKKPEQKEPQLKLLGVRLERLIDGRHPLVEMSGRMDWEGLERRFSEGFAEAGRPGLPVRVVVGLMMLKHEENLSDDVLLQRWVENPYWQYFCGYEYFQHELACDPTSLVRWRKRLGKEGAEALLQETLRIAQTSKVMKPAQVTQVVVDTTAQEKNITFPTDAKLVHRAREKLVQLADKHGLELRQSYPRVSKQQLFKYSRYSHAKQYKRAKSTLSKMSTLLGRVMRDIVRKAEASGTELQNQMLLMLELAGRIRKQVKDRTMKNKVYSLHEPEVACIAKGKAHKRYEFGSKVSVATTAVGSWVLGMQSYPCNPYDGSTLKAAVEDVEARTGAKVETIYVDKGYRGNKHWPQGSKVIVSGRKRLSKREARLLKRRQAIEPVIGHMKSDHRMARNFLKGTLGDELNAILAGAAFNFRKLLRFFRIRLFVLLLRTLFSQKQELGPGALPAAA